LQAAESLFVIYLKDFATLNAVYGGLGGIMALLLWIYLSGCILIFGTCLCAAQAEGRASPAETTKSLSESLHGPCSDPDRL
jgi:Ca2+-transporting ATPase